MERERGASSFSRRALAVALLMFALVQLGRGPAYRQGNEVHPKDEAPTDVDGTQISGEIKASGREESDGDPVHLLTDDYMEAQRFGSLDCRVPAVQRDGADRSA